MHARMFLRTALAAILVMITIFGATRAIQAQVDPDTRASLAAITLTADELPSDYMLIGEAFVAPDGGASDGEVPAEFADAGFLGKYMSVYETADGASQITSYASAWIDTSAAEAGFALLESTGDGTDEPLEAGAGPAELTVTGDGFDATFVADRFVVGVSVSGGAIGQDGIAALVSSLESRADAVAGGETPAGTDLALPASVLDTASLGAEVRAGYLAASEAERLYGLTGSSLGGMQSSWVSLVATGAEATSPYVTIAVSNFESPDNATRVVEQAEQLVPLTMELDPIDDVTVEGAESARAFQYTSSGNGEAGSPDSVRIVAQVGGQVMVVDVQGADSIETAQAAAVTLANAQVACVGGFCEVPDVTLGGQ